MAIAKIIRGVLPKVINEEQDQKDKLRENNIPSTNINTKFSLLKSSITEKGIEIIPPEIFFKDIEPNQTYEVYN